MAAIRQQHRHVIEATHLLGIGLRRLGHLIHLQRHRLQALLQANQALGEGRNGLGQILGGARDPEGDRFSGHGAASNCPDDTTATGASQASSLGFAQQTWPTLAALPAMAAPLNLVAYLLAGLAGGLLALRTGIPAAPLAGALLGAGLLSMSGRLEPAQWPPGPPRPARAS